MENQTTKAAGDMMDEETRIACESTIKRYAHCGHMLEVLSQIGWRSNRTDREMVAEQAPHVLDALLPILDGETIEMLMRSIAELLVRDLDKQVAA